MQLKDYYKTIGVSPNATLSEIKKAYRALAVKYHPDKNEGSELGEAVFKEINEAYRTLSNERRRAAYNDERWLSGIGGNTSYKEAVTPDWLLKVCLELNHALTQMDTHRLSKQTLQTYMLMVLADAHMGILLRDGNETVRRSVIDELLKAAGILDYIYLPEILKCLQIVANQDTDAVRVVDEYAAARLRQDRREKMFPYIVIAITLGLCVFMYFYGNIR